MVFSSTRYGVPIRKTLRSLRSRVLPHKEQTRDTAQNGETSGDVEAGYGRFEEEEEEEEEEHPLTSVMMCLTLLVIVAVVSFFRDIFVFDTMKLLDRWSPSLPSSL